MGTRVEFALETTSGARRATRELHGRHVLVVLEGPEATGQNDAMKARLRTLAVAHPGLAARLALVPVACLGVAGTGFTASIARAVVTSQATTLGHEIWLDPEDRVAESLGLDPRRSNVLVLDARGVVCWGWAGPLTPAALEALLALLGVAVGV